MGETYSKEWSNAGKIFGVSTVTYLSVFMGIYKNMKSRSPNDRKILSALAMSTLNATIDTFVLLFDLFHRDYCKELHCIEPNPPGIPFYVYAQMSAYMIVDGLTETILYCWYKNSPRFKFNYDWATILHHILILSTSATLIPRPIYYWFMISIWPVMEMTTIFLNINKLGRYYDFFKQLKGPSMIGFIVTWFFVRIPIMYISWWRVTRYSKEFFSLSFWRSIVLMVIMIMFTSLNSWWSILILKKLLKKIAKHLSYKLKSN